MKSPAVFYNTGLFRKMTASLCLLLYTGSSVWANMVRAWETCVFYMGRYNGIGAKSQSIQFREIRFSATIAVDESSIAINSAGHLLKTHESAMASTVSMLVHTESSREDSV